MAVVAMDTAVVKYISILILQPTNDRTGRKDEYILKTNSRP